MSYKPGDSYYKEFTTSNPSTGAATNADSPPAATANHNGTDDGAFTLTVTNLDAGRYKITGTIPSGYAAGDVLNVSVAATVNSVAGKAVVDTQVLDGYRLKDVASGAGAAAGVNLNLAQVLSAPRAQDALADSAITTADCLWGAHTAAFGRDDASSGSTRVRKTPSTGTTLRTLTVTTSPTNPFGSNYPVGLS